MRPDVETNEQILLRAIEKAQAKGWRLESTMVIPPAYQMKSLGEQLRWAGHYSIIFSEPFLHALFGRDWEQRRDELAGQLSPFQYLAQYLEADHNASAPPHQNGCP